MKVGDLVELSSYGRKRQYNLRVQDCVGIIIQQGEYGFWNTFRVRWNQPKPPRGNHDRRELKYAKIK